jgi:GNAT superfamily N-acetyltransferase
MAETLAEKLDPIPLTITYLEMLHRPNLTRVQPRGFKLALMRAENPPVSFYRYLYDAIGGEWQWLDRKRLSDTQLLAIISDERVEVSVLYSAGVPAGFVELDFRKKNEANINYLGLMPDFIGNGLGRFLLHWAIEDAWSREIKRLTINTCTLDHPGALPLYQSAGFAPYARKNTVIDPNV